MGTRDDLLFDSLHPGILPEGSGKNFSNLFWTNFSILDVISILSIFSYSFLIYLYSVVTEYLDEEQSIRYAANKSFKSQTIQELYGCFPLRKWPKN